MSEFVATTHSSGLSKINGTQTLLSWTAPKDGSLHAVEIFALLTVTGAETGGAVVVQLNGATVATIFAGGQAAGSYAPSAGVQIVVPPAAVVAVVQSTALTAGASSVTAGITQAAFGG